MTTTARGVRQINENVLQPGRTIIVTETNQDNYDWADIPNGSLFVSSQGLISVKIDG